MTDGDFLNSKPLTIHAILYYNTFILRKCLALLLPGSSTERTIFEKNISKLTPFHYCFQDGDKRPFKGEKPKALPADTTPTKRDVKHCDYSNSYVNPILKAREYEKMLEHEGMTQSQIARNLGVSRTRINQFLNLLKLPLEKQEYILLYGKEKKITEYKLTKISSYADQIPSLPEGFQN